MGAILRYPEQKQEALLSDVAWKNFASRSIQSSDLHEYCIFHGYRVQLLTCDNVASRPKANHSRLAVLQLVRNKNELAFFRAEVSGLGLSWRVS